jgi:hypothetical protein
MGNRPMFGRDTTHAFVEKFVRMHPRASVDDIARAADAAKAPMARQEISAIRRRVRQELGEPREIDTTLLPSEGKAPPRIGSETTNELPSHTEEIAPPTLEGGVSPEAEAAAKERVESYSFQATADADLDKDEWKRLHAKAEGAKAKKSIRVRFMRARLDQTYNLRASDLIAEMKDVFGMAIDTALVHAEHREYILTMGTEDEKARLRKPKAEDVLVPGQGYRVKDPSKPTEEPQKGWTVRTPSVEKPSPSVGGWTVRESKPAEEITSPPQLTVVKAPPQELPPPQPEVSFASSEGELTVASETDRLISWREKGKNRWRIVAKDQAALLVQELFKRGIAQDEVVVWKPTKPKVQVEVKVTFDD